MWWLRKVRRADIPACERDIFERYGEPIIGSVLASGLQPHAPELQPLHGDPNAAIVGHARDWLTERADSRERREQWTSTRDFILEIVVIGLIGWEIHMSYRQEQLQSKDFDKQQQALTNLEKSSAETANTLAGLQRTTELMNTALQMQLDAAKKSAAETARTAKAGEASASTASQALHVSERAYVHMTTSLAKPPATGEKLQPTVVVANVGRTPALDVATRFFFSPVPTSAPIKTAHYIAFASYPQGQRESVYTLASGQTATMQADSQGPLPQLTVDQITDGKELLYVFATASYKDVFNKPHHTETCTTYQPKLHTFAA
jgi:hypothetical protein